ncbi:Flp pilus assembly CpaE family ATPase [Sphingomonas sp. UYAg733]
MSDDSVPEMNEIEAAAHEAKRARAAADAADEARESGNWPILPISIGVGSAALAAALLYANRSRKKRD